MISVLFLNVNEIFDNVFHAKLIHNLKKKMHKSQNKTLNNELFSKQNHDHQIQRNMHEKCQHKHKNISKLVIFINIVFVLQCESDEN